MTSSIVYGRTKSGYKAVISIPKPAGQKYDEHFVGFLRKAENNGWVCRHPQSGFVCSGPTRAIAAERLALELAERKLVPPSLYTDATVRVTREEAEQYLGPPCRDQQVGCPVCDGWSQWQRDGTVSFTVQREALFGFLQNDA